MCKMLSDQNLTPKQYAKLYGDYIGDKIPYNKMPYDLVADSLDDSRTLNELCNPKPIEKATAENKKEKFENDVLNLKPVDYDELVNYSEVDF